MEEEAEVNGFQSRLKGVQEEAKANPNNVASQCRLGWMLLGLKRLDDAKNTLESALSRWPDNLELNYALGLTYKALDQNDKASERFRKVVDGKDKTARESMFQLMASEQMTLIRT